MSTDKSTVAVAGMRTRAMAVYTSFICEHVYARDMRGAQARRQIFLSNSAT